MSSIYAHHKGRQVTIRPGARGNYLTAGFPGWGAAEADIDAHLKPIADVAGMTGTVIAVSSHGSNPWTRYSIRLANGGMIIDGVPGADFDWAGR